MQRSWHVHTGTLTSLFMGVPISRTWQSLALVGMSGCGKTTVGELLAERLGLPFFDSDLEVERETSMSIAELFARYGEAGFRRRERSALIRILIGEPCVVATGGGAFVDPDTAGVVKTRALTVWLDVAIDTLVRNIGADRSRPLLETPSSDLRTRLTDMLKHRMDFYAQADLRIAGDGMTARAIADSIASRLDRSGETR